MINEPGKYYTRPVEWEFSFSIFVQSLCSITKSIFRYQYINTKGIAEGAEENPFYLKKMVLHSLRLMESNLFVRATGFWNPGNFGLWNSESEKKCLWNPEYSSRNLYSHLNASLGIQNPSFTDKDWNPVPGIRNPPHGIQNPRLFWIPLRGANPLFVVHK